jgi:hypothetical protein
MHCIIMMFQPFIEIPALHYHDALAQHPCLKIKLTIACWTIESYHILLLICHKHFLIHRRWYWFYFIRKINLYRTSYYKDNSSHKIGMKFKPFHLSICLRQLKTFTTKHGISWRSNYWHSQYHACYSWVMQ